MKRKWIIFELLVLYISVFAAVYIGLYVDRNGFDWLWILPVTFACCFHVLLKCMLKGRYTLFFYVFAVVAALRYVVGPFLHVLTGEYLDRYIRSIPSSSALNTAIWLMAYELICCTLFLWFAVVRSRKFSSTFVSAQVQTEELIMPKRYWVYAVFLLITGVMTVVYPYALAYFSFFTFSFPISLGELSVHGIMVQITIMLLVTAKYLLFVIGICFFYKKYINALRNRWLVEICAFVFTLICGVTYYGGNRAQFLINLICSMYVFFLLFSQNKKKYIVISAVFGLFVLVFMTEQRGYGDTYANTSGIERVLYKLNQTIVEYFGGIDHVAIAIEMAGNYSGYRSMGQFINDLFVPVVGVNKILGLDDQLIANTLFNYQFFSSVKNVTQILPSIGHGYFYFGFLFAPVIDIFQLWIVLEFIKKHNSRKQLELIFLMNIVIMRFGLMFGQNISQQMNGLSMQLMLPIIVYYFNNKLVLKKRG